MLPSAWRVPVMVTVRLFFRSAVEPALCLVIVMFGPRVTFTSQLGLVTVSELVARLLIVPRASAWPVEGVAPGVGHAAARPPPPLVPAKPLPPPAGLRATWLP